MLGGLSIYPHLPSRRRGTFANLLICLIFLLPTPSPEAYDHFTSSSTPSAQHVILSSRHFSIQQILPILFPTFCLITVSALFCRSRHLEFTPSIPLPPRSLLLIPCTSSNYGSWKPSFILTHTLIIFPWQLNTVGLIVLTCRYRFPLLSSLFPEMFTDWCNFLG